MVRVWGIKSFPYFLQHIYFSHLSKSIDTAIDIDTCLCTYQDTETNIVLIMFPLYKWENLKFTTFLRSTTFE